MKKLLFSLAAATALLATTPTFAQGRPNDRDNNYGYAKGHKVTPDERKRWDDQHKGDHKDDHKSDDHKNGNHKGGDHKNDRPGDNYGYAKDHKVSPEERSRWEAAHKNDRPGDRH